MIWCNDVVIVIPYRKRDFDNVLAELVSSLDLMEYVPRYAKFSVLND